MNRIVVNQSAIEQFRGQSKACAVFDTAGKKLGYFLPEVDASQFEGTEPPFSRDELRHADAEQGGRKLADILADLERRT